MTDCVFCKIVQGELPCYKVYEDETFLAFLDIHPQSPGHVQVIPKEHYRWIWDVPNIGQYFEVVRTIAQAQRKAFNTDWIITKAVGDEVHHAHIWVFPNDKVEGDKKDFTTNLKKLTDSIHQ